MGKELGFVELDLSSFEGARDNGFKIIKEDALLSGKLSLDLINEEFEEIHKSLSHTSIVKKSKGLSNIPFIGGLFKESSSEKINGLEGRLNNIFISYEENYQSLIKSCELYNSNIESLGNKINALSEHITIVPLDNDDNKLYVHKVRDLISALTGTRTRMIINLDTAKEIKTHMKLNKPIFRTIIDALIFEKAGEIGLRAAQDSIDVMNKFIVSSSNKLTDNTIAFSKDINSNRYNTINGDAFKNNLKKLGDAIKEISEIKKKAVIDFDKANGILITNNNTSNNISEPLYMISNSNNQV